MGAIFMIDAATVTTQLTNNTFRDIRLAALLLRSVYLFMIPVPHADGRRAYLPLDVLHEEEGGRHAAE